MAEWVSDSFDPRLPGGVDPRGTPGAPLQVVRGGSFFDGEDRLRGTFRTSRPR